MYVIILVIAGIAASLLGRLPATVDSPRQIVTDVPAVRVTDGTSGQTEAANIDELDQGIELKRDDNGYFFADVQINGAPVHMLVDTGATVIALSRNDAQMAGLATAIGMNDVIGKGADGDVRGEAVTLDKVTLGGKSVDNVPAIVLNSGGQSLLGQSFLSKFASVKIQGDTMVLR